MPEDHVRLAFELADRYFPKHNKLMYNDNNWVIFRRIHPSLYAAAEAGANKGVVSTGLVFQYHMFALGGAAEKLANDMLDPEYMLKVIDLDASAGVPIDISEITILGTDELGDGETAQAQMLERLYRCGLVTLQLNLSFIGILWTDAAMYVRAGMKISIKPGCLILIYLPKKHFWYWRI